MVQKKQPYSIKVAPDGTATLIIGDVVKQFRNKKALEAFAQELYDQCSKRFVGMFRLQDTEDGHLSLIFNRGGNVIRMRDCLQGERFAESIINELNEL